MKTLGKSIKALRERERWSQSDFARKLEVHKNLAYRWENGLSVPHPDHIGKMCELFGVDEYTLFCYRGD